MKTGIVGVSLLLTDRSRGGHWLGKLKSSPLPAGFLAAVAYYLGAKLGFALTLQPQPVSVLWPPNSILLAALLLTPARWWWFIFLMVAPAHWAAQLQSDVPQKMILCWFVSNGCEALIGASCIRLLSRGEFHLDTFRNTGIFILGGVFLGPFLSSFLDAGFVALNRWGDSAYWDVWRTRFFSNALAAVTLATVIVSWSNAWMRGIRKTMQGSIAEAAILSLSLVLVSLVVFVRQEPGVETRGVLLYLPLPFLLWAAVRFGVAGASASLLAFTLISVWGTAHGAGPFASHSPLENALSLQIFLLVICIPQLCLAAALEERGQAEEALRSSEERYREVIETQTDLICRFLPDTTLTFVNEAYCRFFHRRREELIGLKWVELIPESEREKTLERIAALAKAPGVQTAEHEVLLPDGRRAWHHWVNHAICGSGGRVIELQAIGRDISDRKRAEEADAKLAHVSRLALVGELTASIAHEINQPLGAILSNADAASMLLEANPEKIDDVKQILADIRKDDARASEIVRHVRKLLRKRHLEMRPLEINAVLSAALELIRVEAHRRNMVCEADLQPNLPLVKGDQVDLQQVLLNFALNGLDAMSETPQDRRLLNITSTVLASREVEVTVSDRGCGIATGRLPMLFESFVTTKQNGLGLGLSICRAIIEAHHGRIWAENNPEGGATFHFTLPTEQTTAGKK
jgi:two-component system, LuxR family, sensor kinase FixL